MPWQQHISASHATWATRFVTGSEKSGPTETWDAITHTPMDQPWFSPWIDPGSHLLSNISPSIHPALAMLRASHDKLLAGGEDPGHSSSSPNKPWSGLQHSFSPANPGETAIATLCDMPHQPPRGHRQTS